MEMILYWGRKTTKPAAFQPLLHLEGERVSWAPRADPAVRWGHPRDPHTHPTAPHLVWLLDPPSPSCAWISPPFLSSASRTSLFLPPQVPPILCDDYSPPLAEVSGGHRGTSRWLLPWCPQGTLLLWREGDGWDKGWGVPEVWGSTHPPSQHPFLISSSSHRAINPPRCV